MTCREFTERLADHVDGTLSDRAQRAVRRHAARCRGCRTYLDQYRATRAAVGALAEWDELESDDVLDVPGLLQAAEAGRAN